MSPVAELSGWKPEELQSVATLDLVPAADRARAEAAISISGAVAEGRR